MRARAPPPAQINFGIGCGIVIIGIFLLSVLQWCRQMRKQRGAKGGHKQPSEGDRLLAAKRDGAGGAGGLPLTDHSPSEGGDSQSQSYVLDGGSSYNGDGASTFGDGASTYGDGASSAGDYRSEYRSEYGRHV
eukprot:2920503-Prymnesium_polylepis.1